MLTGVDAGMQWFADPSDPRDAPEIWARVDAAMDGKPAFQAVPQ